MKWLKWRMHCPNPTWIHSMFSPLFSIQPLPVSVSDCRSECVWEGESKFFHGSSQPLAHSAAKWVTVYPLPQLRVLMCKSVYVENVWICLRVCVCISANTAVRALCVVSLFLSVSLCHTHALINRRHCTHRGSFPSMQGYCEKRVRGKDRRCYGADGELDERILTCVQICKQCYFFTVFATDAHTDRQIEIVLTQKTHNTLLPTISAKLSPA